MLVLWLRGKPANSTVKHNILYVDINLNTRKCSQSGNSKYCTASTVYPLNPFFLSMTILSINASCKYD